MFNSFSMSTNLTYLFVLLYFTNLTGMDIATYIPTDCWKNSIFKHINFGTKRDLAMVSKSFNIMMYNHYFSKVNTWNTKEFINNLYACENDKSYTCSNWLIEKGNDYNKAVFINLYRLWHKNKYTDKKFESCLNNNNLNKCVKTIYEKCTKQHIKFFIPMSEVDLCISEFKLSPFKNDFNDLVEKSEYDGMKKIVQNVGNFFKKEKDLSIENFDACYHIIENATKDERESYITRALQQNNLFVLACLFSNLINTNIKESQEESNTRFTNAIYDHQKLLAQTHYLNLYTLLNDALNNRKRKEALDIFSIIFKRGDTSEKVTKDILQDIFTNNLLQILPKFIKLGFKLNTDALMSLTSDQIKKFVEIGYKNHGTKFWLKGNYHIFLHEAVQLNDIDLVKYLLSTDADPNALNDDKRTPILYALNDDNMCDFLIKQKKYEGDTNPHEIIFNDRYARHSINAYINDYSEVNMIKLIENNFIINNLDSWVHNAIKKSKFKLCECLLKKINNISDEYKSDFLCTAICYGAKKIFNSLLKLGAPVDSKKIAEYSLNNADNQMLIALLDKGFDISLLYSWNNIKAIFSKVDESELLKYLNNIENKSRLFDYAARFQKWKIVEYLLLLSNFDIPQDCESILGKVFENISERIIVNYLEKCDKKFPIGRGDDILYHAASKKKNDIIKHLLLLNIDVVNCNTESNFFSFYEVFEHIDENIVIKYFNDNKEKMRNKVRQTLLSYALSKKKWSIAQCLLSLGIDTINKYEFYYLERIIINIDEKVIVNHLINDNETITSTNGELIYIYAIKNNKWEIIKCFMDFGTDITSTEHNPFLHLILENIDENTIVDYINKHHSIITENKKLFYQAIDYKKWKIITCLMSLFSNNTINLEKYDLEQLTANINERILLEYFKKCTLSADKSKYLLYCAINKNKYDLVRYLFSTYINKSEAKTFKNSYSDNDENMIFLLNEITQEYTKEIDLAINILNNNGEVKIEGIEKLKKQHSSWTDKETLMINALYFLAKELQKDHHDNELRRKIRSIKFSETDHIYALIQKIAYDPSLCNAIMNAMVSLATINWDFQRIISLDDINNRSQMKTSFDRFEHDNADEVKKDIDLINKIYYRPTADLAYRKIYFHYIKTHIKKKIGTLLNFPGKYHRKTITIDQAPSVGNRKHNDLLNLLSTLNLLSKEKGRSIVESERYMTSLNSKIEEALTDLKNNPTQETYNAILKAQKKSIFNPQTQEKFNTWKRNNGLTLFQLTWNPIYLIISLTFKIFSLFGFT